MKDVVRGNLTSRFASRVARAFSSWTAFSRATSSAGPLAFKVSSAALFQSFPDPVCTHSSISNKTVPNKDFQAEDQVDDPSMIGAARN